MTGRRLLALVTILALVATGIALRIDEQRGSAATAVDFGIIGPQAIASWQSASLTPVAAPSPSLVLPLLLGLAGGDGLAAHALAVSDPSSTSYGQYRSVAENGQALNASDATIAAVTSWFAANGVTVTVDPTRTYVQADVPISVIQTMTGTTYGGYTMAGLPAGVVIYTPTVAPTSVVAGLDGFVDRVYGATVFWNSSTNHPFSVRSEPDQQRSTPNLTPSTAPVFPINGGTPWRTGTAGDACAPAAQLSFSGRPFGLSPGQLRSAYGIDSLWNAGHRGRGARIAIVDSSPYLPADIAAFRACFGLEGTPITDHVIGSPLDLTQSVETTLDIETVLAIAPEADRIDWFGVAPRWSETQIGRTLLELVTAPLDASMTGGVNPDVITVSFGDCEPVVSSLDPGASPLFSIFEQSLATAVASGIGVYVATGDNGSSECHGMLTGAAAVAPAVWTPSTSQWVTAVGGTNITLSDDNRIASAGTWNDGAYGVPPNPQTGQVGSGGGGISTFMERPVWQSGVGVPGGAMRLVPDVSAFADAYPGYLIYVNGAWTAVGGTSAATPLTAAAMALQSSAARSCGRPGLGFTSPLLYSLAAAGAGSADPVIVDVTEGTNDAYGVGVYAAGTGFDMASGLGWVRHDRLAQRVASKCLPVAPRFTG